MPFTRQQFVKVRNFLYHNTSWANLPSISEAGRLKSAAFLAHDLGHGPLRLRRLDAQRLLPAGPVLQSQRPLIEGHICFQEGWEMTKLLDRLNSLVFFWPGNDKGSIPNGQSHFASADGPTDPVTLRVPTKDVFEKGQPLFSKYNSGSPRSSGGIKSPRGPRTFLSESESDWTPSQVIEVVFTDQIEIPSSTQVWHSQKNGWVQIKEAGQV